MNFNLGIAKRNCSWRYAGLLLHPSEGLKKRCKTECLYLEFLSGLKGIKSMPSYVSIMYFSRYSCMLVNAEYELERVGSPIILYPTLGDLGESPSELCLSVANNCVGVLLTCY